MSRQEVPGVAHLFSRGIGVIMPALLPIATHKMRMLESIVHVAASWVIGEEGSQASQPRPHLEKAKPFLNLGPVHHFCRFEIRHYVGFDLSTLDGESASHSNLLGPSATLWMALEPVSNTSDIIISASALGCFYVQNIACFPL